MPKTYSDMAKGQTYGEQFQKGICSECKQPCNEDNIYCYDCAIKKSALIKEDKIIKEKIDAQEHYCYSYNLEILSPAEGICYNCGKQIYYLINLKTAKKEHVTHCPYCNCSFCE